MSLLRGTDPGRRDHLSVLRSRGSSCDRERTTGRERETAVSEATLRDRRAPQAWDHACRSETAAISVGEDRWRTRTKRAPARTTRPARNDSPRIPERAEIPARRGSISASGLGDRPTGRPPRENRREVVSGAASRGTVLT